MNKKEKNYSKSNPENPRFRMPTKKSTKNLTEFPAETLISAEDQSENETVNQD